MRFLLDMPVSPGLVELLTGRGHHAEYASHLGLYQATDEELVILARQTGSIIITADLDFPQLLALSGAPDPGIILFRGGAYADAEMRALLMRVLDAIPEADLINAICVVDRRRVRLTRLPLRRK
jgi:predicted nuclease of predicted toxin-antitoxin system